MISAEILTDALKKAGMRITPQRIAICRLLSQMDSHPTAAMLYDEIRREYPTISLATVYNTLDALGGLGMVNVLGSAGDGKVHFDADTSPHINLACTHCHKIIDLPSVRMSRIESEVSQISNYALQGARILYYGLCPQCQTINNQK